MDFFLLNLQRNRNSRVQSAESDLEVDIMADEKKVTAEQQLEDEKLSDEELDNVAGGISPPDTIKLKDPGRSGPG